MFQRLINRSADLKRLRDEGYDLELKEGYLLVKQVPYVNAAREVRRGILVSELMISGEQTGTPSSHQTYFHGEHPCHKDGSKLQQIAHGSAKMAIGKDFATDHSFSARPKPADNYTDYHHKITTYVRIISAPAQALDPSVTAHVFPAIAADEDTSVFNYIDTASSRYQITGLMARFEGHKIGILGLGGTGSYILDFVSKTPVAEIHIFDGDEFSNHNAFRSPGAASLEELDAKLPKVIYLSQRYSAMHRHVIPHPYDLTDTNSDEVAGFTFVFLCVDKASARRSIVEALERHAIPFIHVGMDVDVDPDNRLRGGARVTFSTRGTRAQARTRISFEDPDDVAGDYKTPIQIADLNALNAIMAVIRWKKHIGVYRDTEQEQFSAYMLDGNAVINDNLQ